MNSRKSESSLSCEIEGRLFRFLISDKICESDSKRDIEQTLKNKNTRIYSASESESGSESEDARKRKIQRPIFILFLRVKLEVIVIDGK